MANVVSIFNRGIVPTSDAARERADLKRTLLESSYTREIYGPGVDEWDVKPDDLMPDPDEMQSRWGFADDTVFDDMAGNVLPYGGFVEGRMDVSMSLKLSFLVGVKGDKESEEARDEIEACYNAIPERFTVEREMCRAAERGFMGAENVFGVQSIGPAKGLVTIVEMFNRPRKMFAFDWRNRPWFKPHGRIDTPTRIDDYKVTFSRQGSLHTKYGSGYGQRCYPTVFAIDRMMKQHMAAVERASWMPIIVKHPRKWDERRRRAEYAIFKSQWKNVLLVPADVDEATPVPLSDSLATHEYTGNARMELIRELVSALAGFIRGSQLSSGNQQEGSYARDVNADSAQLWKAPTDAAAREAMWNRGLIEPTMLANRPNMDRAKWPRCSVDASFGEDLRLFMELCEQGARNGVRIATVTWSERTGIPIASDDEPNVLTVPQAPSVAPLLPDGMAADEFEDPTTGAVRRMSEPASIRIRLEDGRVAWMRPSAPVLTDKGIVMAKHCVGGGAVKLLSAGAQKFGRAAS